MRSALVVIDVQIGILEGPPAAFEPSTLLANIGLLLSRARDSAALVVFVKHDGPPEHRVAKGSRGWAIAPQIAPLVGETVVHKRECDAFYETELNAVLRGHDVKRLVVAGLMTQYCIDTTCRRAFSLGYDVVLAGDAHSTGDTAGLTAAQIIAHHNASLDDFGGGAHTIRVVPALGIAFDRA